MQPLVGRAFLKPFSTWAGAPLALPVRNRIPAGRRPVAWVRRYPACVAYPFSSALASSVVAINVSRETFPVGRDGMFYSGVKHPGCDQCTGSCWPGSSQAVFHPAGVPLALPVRNRIPAGRRPVAWVRRVSCPASRTHLVRHWLRGLSAINVSRETFPVGRDGMFYSGVKHPGCDQCTGSCWPGSSQAVFHPAGVPLALPVRNRIPAGRRPVAWVRRVSCPALACPFSSALASWVASDQCFT